MKLHLGKKLSLPKDAVTQTFALFGKRGSGKTNGATVLVEELLKAELPVVVLDPVDAWWGLKSSFDGKGPGFPIYIFGGPHGDLPLEPTAGVLIADMVAKEHVPLVLSMKMWGIGERARFVTDFAKRLLQVNQDPVMMVLEEADAFIPQRPAKGEEAMLGAMDRLVRWGRQSGVGCTIVTQRSAKVNKDVTTQAETLVAFRTTGPQDRDAIDHWIKFHAGEEKREEVLASLATLPNGTAWVWSPEWLEVFDQIPFRRRETFDSAATPKVGENRPKPKQLAAVDLDRLRDQMASTIEKAKADDPRELRRQIAELKKDLAKKPAAAPRPGPAPKVRQVPVLKDSQVKRLEVTLERISKEAERHRAAMTVCWSNLNAVAEALLKAMHSLVTPASPPAPSRPTLVPSPAPAPRARAPRPHLEGNGQELGKGEITILCAVAQQGDAGATREQLTVLTGYRRSTRDTYLQRLRAEDLVAIAGDRIRVTEGGVAALGDRFEPLPTGDELRAHWMERLPEGEAKILELVIKAYPSVVEREFISEMTGYARSSRDTYLQRLSSRRLVDASGRGAVRASENLFS